MSDFAEISLWERVLLKIPFVRKRLAINTYRVPAVENINLFMAKEVLPHLCKMYSDRMITDSVCFVNRDYYVTVLKSLFGKQGESFGNQIKFEWAKIRGADRVKICVLTIPHESMVGQAVHIGIVMLESSNNAVSYSMEISADNKNAVCEWCNKTHFFYDTVETKADFVKKIVSLSTDGESEDCSEYDELDLKHRLAKEIGVRVENLDFYMSKFQHKVELEMQGIDTSGIDSDILDKEEWIRYCNWEIQQAMKRVSPEELKMSEEILHQLIARDKYRNN